LNKIQLNNINATVDQLEKVNELLSNTDHRMVLSIEGIVFETNGIKSITKAIYTDRSFLEPILYDYRDKLKAELKELGYEN